MINNDNLIQLMEERLASLKPSQLTIRDDTRLHEGHHESLGAGHFKLTIDSEQFKGKDILSCHRLIYNALGDLFPNRIHALRISLLNR
ncbi:MAG: BolA family transcriptional regulator [Betaproteobacteria bacterium]|nr:BolA/IbaG family iron-sulfur metabolism protein [Betaproteobacteria bacterium]MDE2422792.1 BolA family transcriptional regulator [Betaproteobacteria bacterium]